MKKNGFFTGLLYVMLVLLTVGLGLIVFFNYGANREQQQTIEAVKEAEAATPTPAPVATPEPTPEPERNAETITLAFAGDLVGQAGLTTDARHTDGDAVSYDFSDELDGVEASLEDADLAMCTLVSTVTSSGEYDAYLMPAEVGGALRDAGFDLVNAATDHILDRGLEGLTETVGHLKNSGLGVVGAYDSASRSFPVADVHGIKVGFLSYAYSTASGVGGSMPVSVADNSWCLDLLTSDYMTAMETVDYEKIDADIAAVKQAGADVVVCFVYWWDNTRYYTEPRTNQTEVADHLLESGVDILIGGGVKSPQPIETRTVERADGTAANCVVCYSLSNLMSCFTDDYTDLSAVAQIEISRDTDSGEIWVSGVKAVPLYMQADTDAEVGSRYRVLDAEAEIARFDAGESGAVSQETYDALKGAVTDLATLMGGEYFNAVGNKLDFPYAASKQ